MKYGQSFLFLFVALGLCACTIPEKKPKVPLGPGQIIVNYGDTIYSVAERHNVSVRQLINTNRLVAPYAVNEGQILMLPAESSEALANAPSGPKLLMGEEEALPRWQPSDALGAESPVAAPSGEMLSAPAPVGVKAAPELLEEVRGDVEQPCPEPKAVPSTPEQKVSPVREGVASAPVFSRPVSGEVLKEFGAKGDDGKKCQGVRFAVEPNESVSAACEGTILFSGNELGGQNIVVLQHPNNWLTAYGPLRRIAVSKGQVVRKGSKLGLVSGKSLYFEVRHNRVPVNPLKFF